MLTRTWLLLLALTPALALAEAGQSPDPAQARTFFQQARALSERDAGELWGRPLDGPMLFVDPATRRVVANRADGNGHLSPRDGAFTGELPAEVNVANTATEWAGVLWTMILWPLPEDELSRGSLLMHESFHRLQGELGLPAANPANDHLDTMNGRLWLQLEWRALAAALARSGKERRGAIEDALVFRAWRRSLFPQAGAGEAALEMNEGLAEYTGLKLSVPSRSTFLEKAVAGLEQAPSRRSFVRSFAYASGPAYGFLLDAAAADWRRRLEPATDLGELLRGALAVELPRELEREARQRARRYGGGELETAEAEREKNRRELLATYRARFVDGPVLVLPMAGETNFSFNPNELVPLEGHGTIYPTLRVTDAWGILEVSGGALMSFEKGEIRVEAAAAADVGGRPLVGPGWKLELSAGWEPAPGQRRGDFRLTRTRKP